MFKTQRSFFGPTYEDFQPVTETKETPESYLLLIHLPPGFAREHFSAKFESSDRRVWVFGERPLGSNRWSRFNVVYQVPESCEANKLKRKFEGGIVTVTMPKKVISKAISPKDQELVKLPAQQAAPKPPSYATDHESKALGRVEGGEANSNEVKCQKGKEVISQEPQISRIDEDEKKEVASVPLKATTGDSMTQKGQEGVEKKSGLKVDKKIQTDEIEGPFLEYGEKQRVEQKSGLKMDKKIQTDAVENGEIERASEKAQEVFRPRPTTGVEEGTEEKAQKRQEGKNEKLARSVSENGKNRGAEKKETKEVIGGKTSEVKGNPPETEMAQEFILAKPSTSRVEEAGKASIAGANADQKGQDGKNEKLARSVSENGKNRGAEKKETREVIGKTSSEVGKGRPLPDVIDLLAENESKKEERKECTKRKRNGKYGVFEEGGLGLKDIINYPKGKRMKEVAASTSQAVTNMAKRFNEKENNKQMVIYVGAAAAVLVTAVIGVCASYTFRSFSRP